MKNSIRKLTALVLVLSMVLSMSALAAKQTPSKGFRLPAVKPRVTEAPADASGAADAPAAPEVTEAPAATEETQAPEAEETPAPAEEETVIGSAYVSLEDASSTLNVRAAATTDSQRLGSLNHGDRVSVLGYEGEWTKIAYGSAFGFVKSSFLSASPAEEEPAEEPTEEPVEEPTEEPVEEPVEEPAEEPTEVPVEEPTEEPTEEPVEEPVEEPTEEPVEEPTEEPTEEPVEEPVEPRYTFERDADGNLVLDENGNPVAIVPEGMEIPLTYLRDENGNLILDENGDPIVKDTVPAGAEKILTLEDMLDPDCYIDVYIAWKDEKKEIGNEATLVAVLYGYDKVVYSLQWQNSKDDENWTDVSGATESRLTVTATEENAHDYWRVQVTVTDVKG